MSREHGITCAYGRLGLQRALLASLAAMLTQSCNSTGEHRAAPLIASASPPTLAASQAQLLPHISALHEGSPAPDVTLTLQDGFPLHLSAEKGKAVALYFCSSEASPDCVREAIGLRDHWTELHLHHVVVVGISSESALVHQAFIAEHKLPFDLVSDADGRIAREFDVPTSGDYAPQTFLIGGDGLLRKKLATNSPESRAQEILDLATN